MCIASANQASCTQYDTVLRSTMDFKKNIAENYHHPKQLKSDDKITVQQYDISEATPAVSTRIVPSDTHLPRTSYQFSHVVLLASMP